MASGPITVYHNPRCSKSRQTVEILAGKGVEFSLFEYLQERPGVDELRWLAPVRPRVAVVKHAR